MISLLLVDDDSTFLETMSDRIQRRLPWRVVSATCVEAAEECLSWTAFDMLVTDLKMPGNDGAALLQHAAAQHPQAIRVLMTGAGFDHRMAKALTWAHDCLVKPFDIRALAGALRRTQWRPPPNYGDRY